MIVFRVCDARFPFLWTVENGALQRAARWHAAGEGPAQYFADTPAGAWAEILRHEDITDPDDFRGLAARVWAVQLEDDPETQEPRLPALAMTSDPEGYSVCQREARRLRGLGARRLITLSAALKAGGAAGCHVGARGLRRAAARDGKIIVHFGSLPNAEGWCLAEGGAPEPEIVGYVRYFGAAA